MFYSFDLKGTRAIQKISGEPLYRLCGSCNNCGACCETPMIQVFAELNFGQAMIQIFPLFFYLRSSRWLIKKWHQLVNGFEYIGEDRRAKSFIFRCTHWDPETKMCDSYDSRPGMCRDYPRPLLYQPNPTFLKPCSFFPVDKNADRMLDALEDLDLSEEQLNTLKQKLHLQ